MSIPFENDVRTGTAASPTADVRRPWPRPVRRAFAAIALALAASVAAQPVTPPSAVAVPALSADIDSDANDAAFEGRVIAYLLSPDASVAGLIFDEGRQVSVPPHLGARLAQLIQPGQQARIGPRRDDAHGSGSGRSITAIGSGRTLEDGPPDEQRPAPRRAGDGLRPLQAVGTIRLRLHGPRGETNGLLLDNGTQVFFPPHVARESSDWLQPGNAIKVDGYGRTSNFGTVLQATRVTGPDGRSVTVYRSADDPDKRDIDRKAPRPKP